MSIKTVVCRNFDRDALIKGIEQPNVKAVIYFFSVEFERFEVHRVIKRAFPQAACIGASMIGGWATAGAVEKGIVAMSLSSDEVAETFVSLQEGVKSNPIVAAQRAIEDLKRKSGHRTFSLNSYLGIVLFDGLCRGEDIIKHFTEEKDLFDGLCRGEDIIKHFTEEKDFNLNIVGGAAADELTFTKTLVSADEKYSADGLVFMIMRMKIPFFCNHYVHCIPSSTSFVITKAEPTKRIV